MASEGSRPAVSGLQSRRAWTWIGAGALIVVVVATVIFLLLQPPPAAESERPASPSASVEVTQRATPSPSPTPSPTPPPRAAFIGDSYTQGGGAEPDTARWSTLVATGMGWIEENYGRGGTGFVTTNNFLGCGLEYCPTYLEMVPEVVAAGPSVVVIAGGQNDFGAYAENPDAVRTAIRDTYAGIRAGLPGATIVAVGPSTPWAIDEVAVGFDAAVRESAAAVGATYISMLEPDIVDPAFLLPDGHVNNDGHRAIADRVISALSP